MLPELGYNQNVFIEITNLSHGGQGWGIGSCLWSPVKDRRNAKSWRIMGEISQGDIIIHLVDLDGHYHWYGISIANSTLIQSDSQPPDAGRWTNMSPYQRVNLVNFVRLNRPTPIIDFLALYDSQLRNILKGTNHGQFYNEYGESKTLRVSQRYISRCPESLYDLFNQYSRTIEFNPIFGENDNSPTANEPQNPDYNPPGRVRTLVSRIVRDTELGRTVKAENNWRCQICGERISLLNNSFYAEGHHLQPLGGEHQGPDIRGNIIILCPTHHAEFDYGCITINPSTNLIEHIDPNNLYHGKSISYVREDLDYRYLRYHHEKRFRQL